MAETFPCPHCNQDIPLSLYAQHFASTGGRIGGRSRSKSKVTASKENGKKGGRPRKQ